VSKHIFAAAVIATVFSQPASAQSDAAIRQKIIRESIESYPGNCPCPYNTDRAGRSCGAGSAYSRPGGYAPKCFPDDVSRADILEYRNRVQGH
jgi:hypothetical protein